MTWTDGCLIVRHLLRDPTSALYAAAAQWDHPYSHEARILADTFDAFLAVNTDPKKRSRQQPYPRPWKRQKPGTKSQRPQATQAQIDAALAARGH